MITTQVKVIHIGAKYFSLIRGLVGIFMFGIQTYFLSKAFSYLIRIFFFSVDNTFLQHDIFLVFISGLNIIDWAAFLIAILLQSFSPKPQNPLRKKD